MQTWLQVKFVDSKLIEPKNLLGLWIRICPEGDGGYFEAKLDKIYKTPSKNPDIISSELSRKDFPIYMNQYKDSYVTVEELMNCIEDERVEFWYKGN